MKLVSAETIQGNTVITLENKQFLTNHPFVKNKKAHCILTIYGVLSPKPRNPLCLLYAYHFLYFWLFLFWNMKLHSIFSIKIVEKPSVFGTGNSLVVSYYSKDPIKRAARLTIFQVFFLSIALNRA